QPWSDDAHLRLRRIRLVDDDGAAGLRGRQRRELQRSALAAAGPRRLPLLELAGEQIDQLGWSGLPDGREQGALLLVAGGVEAERILALEGIHVPAEPLRRMRIGMAGAVSERHQRPSGHRARLVELA